MPSTKLNQPNSMKKLILIAIVGLMFSCKNEAKETVQTSNNNFHVELLFEVEGCKVYRFQDYGSKYFVTNGSINWSETHGKNHHVEVEIPTVQK